MQHFTQVCPNDLSLSNIKLVIQHNILKRLKKERSILSRTVKHNAGNDLYKKPSKISASCQLFYK